MDRNWPRKIIEKLGNMEIRRNEIGMSTAGVFQCLSDTEGYYLKVDSKGGELKDEYRNLRWLNGKAPVPKIIEWDSDGSNEYLLVTKINGLMLCDNYYLNNPPLAVSVLAKGLRLLQSIDISNCGIMKDLEIKLKLAKINIRDKKVDITDWDEKTQAQFKSPELLLEYLWDNKPEKEELVFTHGDYCLPNVLGQGGNVTGFVDMGRAGVSDKWQDIALCTRSLWYNFNATEYDDLLLEELGIDKDNEKLAYYILLDELF